MKDLEIHECEAYKGKIGDVTIDDTGVIHCRRCGERLLDSQVDLKILNSIKRRK